MRTINGVELIPGVTKIFSCSFVDANISSVITCLIVADNKGEAHNKAIKMALTNPTIKDKYELVYISLHHSGFYESYGKQEMDPFDDVTKDGYVLFDAESLR